MGVQNQTAVSLVGVGGIGPYAYAVIADGQTTIPAAISGSVLTVDATSVEPGVYSVHVSITDQNSTVSTIVIPVSVISTNQFTILNEDVSITPSTFPQAGTIPLVSVGAAGSVTWTVVPAVTTLPNVAISGATLTFSVPTFGNWTLGIRATDSVGNTVTRLIEVNVVSSVSAAIVDGQVEINVTPPTTKTGQHTFSLKATDSASSAPAIQPFNYTIGGEVSSIEIPEAAVDHFWGSADNTAVVYPITGSLTGFTLGQSGATIAENGLNLTIDSTNDTLTVTGPPTSFQNSEARATIAVLRNATQVALISREYTLVSHSGTTDIGTITCNTRPYIAGIGGEFVGLNSLKAYFNAPDIFRNQSYTVQLQAGSTLPAGLSLDAITGQVYGNVLTNDVPSSVLQYVDTSGVVHGTVTIQWDIAVSQFAMGATTALTAGQVQAAYTASVGTSSSSPLTTVATYRGRLPQGLTASIDSGGANVVISGTPIEAGYFDIWFRVTNANGQVAFFYTRFVVQYITPLVVLTDAFERLVTGQAFSQTLQAFGGVAPYTWSMLSGTLPTGLTLNAASGILSGTTAVTSYNANITVAVTDSRGVVASAVLPLTINNTLTIVTPVLPLVAPGQPYQIQLVAAGGTGPYTWSLGSGSPALPGGISLSSSGLLSGATSLTSYNQNITIKVTDAAASTASKAFNLVIGTTSGLIIDTEGIGPLVRGQHYQGSLSVIGPGVAPYTWSFSPTSPNAFPTGIVMSGDAATNGATATVSGQTIADLLNYAVQIQVVDANGNLATAFLLLSTVSSLAITTNSPLPQATVTGGYSLAFAATGINTPFVWSVDPSSAPLPPGLTLNSAGVLSGTASVQATSTIVIRVTDALGDYVSKAFSITVTNSTLAITTTSISSPTAGIAYTQSLAATGGVPAYTWSISPNSAAALPSGLNLDPASGTITGVTYVAGFSGAVTFRVTDSLGVYREVTFTLTTAAGLTLTAGPDYVDATTTNSLGIGYTTVDDVTAINPRPNLSFYIVATRVISTSPSGISIGLPPGFTGSVDSLAAGVATIKLSGPFYGPNPGAQTLAVTVNDSGVSVSKTFNWTIDAQETIGFTTPLGSLPIIYLP